MASPRLFAPKPILWFLFSIFLALGLSACGGATFSGPGYDSRAGKVVAPGETLYMAVTHAKLGPSFWDNIKFVRLSARVVNELDNNPGFVGYSLDGSLLEGDLYTMTVWQDEESLDAFVKSPVHAQAMREGWGALADASFVRIPVKHEAVPMAWDDAKVLLKEKGYPSYTMPAPAAVR